MEKEENYSVLSYLLISDVCMFSLINLNRHLSLMLYSLNSELWQASFPSPDYSLHQDQTLHHQPQTGENSGSTDHEMIGEGTRGGYMLNNTAFHHQAQMGYSSGFLGSGSSLDRISFADVMQFADFGPKLSLNPTKSLVSYNSDQEDAGGMDPVCFLKFPVLNDRILADSQSSLMGDTEDRVRLFDEHQEDNNMQVREDDDDEEEEEEGIRVSENKNNPMQLRSIMDQRNPTTTVLDVKNNKKKRPRTTKTSEEVESQRKTHIAVERNRRRQMNDHLRVLRSLMPGSYVQRGDQASIIGGAIEFVRELEQLLQCLESQKRRRLYGDGTGPPPQTVAQPPPNFFPSANSNNSSNHNNVPIPTTDSIKPVDIDQTGFREDMAESKSCLADIEVKVLGFDAMIKILSRRRPGQLLKTIAGLEDLQLNILHTNITTIEHTVLYSFNVKISSEIRFTAEDIANSVQQIFSFIHANSSIGPQHPSHVQL